MTVSSFPMWRERVAFFSSAEPFPPLSIHQAPFTSFLPSSRRADFGRDWSCSKSRPHRPQRMPKRPFPGHPFILRHPRISLSEFFLMAPLFISPPASPLPSFSFQYVYIACLPPTCTSTKRADILFFFFFRSPRILHSSECQRSRSKAAMILLPLQN